MIQLLFSDGTEGEVDLGKKGTLYGTDVVDVSLGSRGGKCAYCHYPGTGYGPDLTDLFDPGRGSVNIASDSGGVRIVPGDPEASVLFIKVKGESFPPNLGRPMPLHFERLTAKETKTLRD
jgi:hypothetical protein